jgi:hypothetical protein
VKVVVAVAAVAVVGEEVTVVVVDVVVVVLVVAVAVLVDVVVVVVSYTNLRHLRWSLQPISCKSHPTSSKIFVAYEIADDQWVCCNSWLEP